MADVRERPDAEPPDRVTVPLLTLIQTHSLDEDYAHVARRRAERAAERESGPERGPGAGPKTGPKTGPETGPPVGDATGSPGSQTRGPGRPSRLTAVVVTLFGVIVAVAAASAHRDEGVEAVGRATLISRILEGKSEVASLQDRAARLRRSVVSDDAALARLDTQRDDLAAVVDRLEVRTGFVAVRGEGVRIVVDDAPSGDLTTQVRDEDLATLVDGLWAAGAEAIAINDQRLTVLTGIRNTDRAVHVNGRPLTAPYTVQAIGDTDTLQASLLATSQGSAWFTLVSSLGFVFSIDNDDDLLLPAARLDPLLHVEGGSSTDDEGRPRDDEEATP